ncbi:MAG: hypothetical protein ACHQ50_09875 [Fimbriimonadales bacterium]
MNDLVDACFVTGRWMGGSDPRYDRLASLGYAFIPIAIRHLGDMRLTRTIHLGGGPAGPHIMTIDDFMYSFLTNASGGELLHSGSRLTRGAAEAWWDRQWRLTEKEYWLSHVFVAVVDWRANRQFVVATIASKYPDQLIPLYRQAIDKGLPAHKYLAECIANSSLGKGERVSALVEGTHASDFGVRSEALRSLEGLDGNLYREALLRSIRDIPAKWAPPENGPPQLVSLLNTSEDQLLWEALNLKVKEIEPRFRASIVSQLSISPRGARRRQRALILGLMKGREPLASNSRSVIDHRLDFRIAYFFGQLLGLRLQPRDDDLSGWEQYTDEVRKLLAGAP